MNEKKPNLVLKNASIYTVDRDRSWAQAIAIADDKISLCRFKRRD